MLITAAVGRDVRTPLSIEQLELRAPGPDEVLVAVDAVAICHSDLSFVDGDWSSALPAVWGHEAAGRVVDHGDTDSPVAVGTPVVVHLIRHCGICRACRRGHPVSCRATFPLDDLTPLSDATGAPVAHGLRTAAFASHVLVHRSQIVPVPELTPDLACLLACGVITGVGAVRNTAQVADGDTVCIVGCGGVGLNAVIGARLAGAATIVAVDPDPDKRTAARGFGAHHDLDPSDPDIDRALADLLGGVGADHVIVATGAPAAHHSAMGLLAPSGTLTIVGMPADGVNLQVSPGDLAGADQRIAGSKMGGAVPGRDIVDLAAAHLRGDFDLAELVSHRHEFHDINLAIDDVRRGATRRSVVTINHTSVSPDTAAGTP